MTSDLKQICFYISSTSFDQFTNHAKRRKVPMNKAFEEAIDNFIEKYDSLDSEKLKQWVPESKDPSYHLRCLYLTKDQIRTLTNLADKAGTNLGQKVTKESVVSSVILEYLSFR